MPRPKSNWRARFCRKLLSQTDYTASEKESKFNELEIRPNRHYRPNRGFRGSGPHETPHSAAAHIPSHELFSFYFFFFFAIGNAFFAIGWRRHPDR
jgi:hypothetical protein